jgi:hypothetical protein
MRDGIEVRANLYRPLAIGPGQRNELISGSIEGNFG